MLYFPSEMINLADFSLYEMLVMTFIFFEVKEEIGMHNSSKDFSL